MFENGAAGESGVENVDPQGTQTQVTATEPTAEPTVLDIDPETLIRIKGQGDKPVKFGEYSRGFQAQHTRASQKAAQLERELQRERQIRAQYEQERQRAAQGQQNGGQADIYAKLRELPYVTGQEAVELVQGIGQQLQQRDMFLAATLRELAGLKQLVTGLNESSTNAAFETKIGKFLSEAGYDPNAEGLRDLATEIYLAYEGDDLDVEFPRIFSERLSQMEKFFNSRREAALRANRRTFVPGKGGNANPSRPLQLKPEMSAKDTADMLWESLQSQGT